MYKNRILKIIISRISILFIWIALIFSMSNIGKNEFSGIADNSLSKVNLLEQKMPTTSITKNKVNLVSVSSILASDFIPNNSNELKKLIMNLIINPKFEIAIKDLMLEKASFNNHTGEIEVSITLLNNKYQKLGISIPSYTFTQKILVVGFRTQDITTTIKNRNIIADSNEFKRIFNNDKGFGEDWLRKDKKEMEKMNSCLKHDMNTNINKYFNNIDENNPTSVSSLEIEIIKENEASSYKIVGRVRVIFNGLENGTNNNEMIDEQSLIISFKTIDSAQQELFDFSSKLTLLANTYTLTFPSNEEKVKVLIAKYLDDKRNNLPNAIIPKIGRFSQQDLIVPDGAIQINHDGIIINQGIMIKNSDNLSLMLPSANVINMGFSSNDNLLINNQIEMIKWIIIGVISSSLSLCLLLLITILIIKKKKSSIDSTILSF